MGVLNGLIGVGYWALWSVGWIEESDAFFHSSLQVQGFLGCFVAGFLMTAMPRFLGTFSASRMELVISFLPAFFFTLLTVLNHRVPAQAAFLLMMASLIPFILRRVAGRTKNPPTSFLLIGFGLTHAILGTSLILWSDFGQQSMTILGIGRQMLQLGFLLCLVLGIAGNLLPFLMGYSENRPTGSRAVLFHGLTGTLIFASFLVEAQSPKAAFWMRAFVASIHLLWFGRIGRKVKAKSIYVYFFWISCWMILAGLWSLALFPNYRLAGLHLIFISGFSLMIFSFGLMVVMSHAGKAIQLTRRLIPLQITGDCVLLAAVCRYIADVDVLRHYPFWIHLSSGFWLVAALIWLVYTLPMLWTVAGD